jgi:hypothetical protein
MSPQQARRLHIMSRKRKRSLEQKGGLGGDRRVREEEEEGRTTCRLYPRCTGRHELVNCAMFKMLPAEHRQSIVLFKKLCQAHLTHKGHGDR